MSLFKKIFGKQQKMTETEFGQAFFSLVQEKHPIAKLIAQNGLELELDLGSDYQIKQFLDNAYAEYNSFPESLSEILHKYSNSLMSFLEEQNAKIETKNIIPVIRNIDFIRGNMELNPKFDEIGLFEKINDELYLFYVVDSPTTMKYLDKDELESLEISKEELKKIAIENLKDVGELQRQGNDGYYGLLLDGNFESSMILLDIWNKDNFNVKGEIVVAIPARDVLFITGSEDLINLEKMRDATGEIFQSGDHVISDHLFIYRDGNFEVFQ